jgi:homocysteine S-methyltransferase
MKTTARYRPRLPQENGGLFLADGGVETSLIFDDGLELPLFAAFPLPGDAGGRRALRQYYERFMGDSAPERSGIRAREPDLAGERRLGREARLLIAEIAAANTDAIALMQEMREAHETPASRMVVSGCIGPRGDGYVPGEIMSERLRRPTTRTRWTRSRRPEPTWSAPSP